MLASVIVLLLCCGPQVADDPQTTLGDPSARFSVSEYGYYELSRGDVTAVIVDNRAVDNETLPGHRAGYSGVASLTHARRPENLFVPNYAGLNFEHIHDGTTQERDILFEPRRSPMELRVINKHTVELYQRPTSTWKLESASRYEMLEDGTLQMTFECIPRADTFRNDYIGLFWASYIHQPESLDIHFRGVDDDRRDAASRWIRGITPQHGTRSTHSGLTDDRTFTHDEDFPLSLVFNRSRHRFAEPWYFGVSHGMAFVLMFRPRDEVRLTQSPSGGGRGNPAWDFQYLIGKPVVGRRYRKVMRAMYVPFQSPEQIERASRPHRRALGQAITPRRQ